MSSIIGNGESATQISNQLWLLLSYIAKKNVKSCEVQDLNSNSEKILTKEVTDFMYIRF